jgi:HEAT repeat protein
MEVAIIDLRNRALVAKRYEETIRRDLRVDDPYHQLAVMHAIVDMDIVGREVLAQHRIGRNIASDLAALTREGRLPIRIAATACLAQINADPELVVPALDALLGSDQPMLRQSAARAFARLMRETSRLAVRTTDVEFAEPPVDIIYTAWATLPIVGRGARDRDPQVRRACSESLELCALVLCRLLQGPQLPRAELCQLTNDHSGRIHPATLAPLVGALNEQMPAVTLALRDSDSRIRLLARRTLEDVASARQRLNAYSSNEGGHHAGGVAEEPIRIVAAECPAGPDPFLDSLTRALDGLLAGLHDEDVSIRRATVDVLEAIGPSAARVVPALIQALADQDRFVRWAAARALARIGPVEATAAVPALTGLLSDDEPGVRQTAASALAGYGPAAKSSSPVLLKSLRSASDRGTRLAAMQALATIGPGSEARPVLRDVLKDSDPQVRDAARELMNQLKNEP